MRPTSICQSNNASNSNPSIDSHILSDLCTPHCTQTDVTSNIFTPNTVSCYKSNYRCTCSFHAGANEDPTSLAN